MIHILKDTEVLFKAYLVSLRRHGKFIVKPECEELDGKHFLFREGWIMDEVDTDIYIGEMAMIPDFEQDGWSAEKYPTWIASGDLLELIEE